MRYISQDLTNFDINFPKQTPRSYTERAPLPIVAFNVEENYFHVFLLRRYTHPVQVDSYINILNYKVEKLQCDRISFMSTAVMYTGDVEFRFTKKDCVKKSV